MSDKDYIQKLEKDISEQQEKYNKLAEESHQKDRLLFGFMELCALKDKVFEKLDKRFSREFDYAEYDVPTSKKDILTEGFNKDECMRILEKIELDKKNTIRYRLKRLAVDNITGVLAVILFLSPFIAWYYFANW